MQPPKSFLAILRNEGEGHDINHTEKGEQWFIENIEDSLN